MNFRSLMLLALLATSVAPAVAGERASLGIALATRGSGIFNPVVSSMTVTKVLPESLAAQNGIAVGDSLLEVAGMPVKGRHARDVMPAFEVGGYFDATFKHTDGKVFKVHILGVKK